MKIAVDIMSAERGPDEVIRGCEKAQEEINDLELILVGPYGNLLQHQLDNKKISIINAQEVLRPDDGRIGGTLKKRKSSLVKIAELINNRDADAGISFTDTRWIMAIINKYLKLPYISRTPLAIKIPSEREKGYTILLDVGATADCEPKYLLEFGILGMYYAKCLGIENPKVGLLSNGTERTKGNKLVKKTLKMFEEYSKKNEKFNFIGYVEGFHIFRGKEPEIIVMDGYIGNIGLKWMESEASFFLSLLYKICREKGIEEVITRDIIETFSLKINPDQYGGAFLLGAKPFIKGHGNSNAESVRTSIKHAIQATSYKFGSELEVELEKAIKAI